jgi:threonine dehydrogenase-like Zn-dependent dehydrogenase
MEPWEGGRVHTYDIVMALIRSGRLSLKGLLTHTFAPEDYRQAFSAIASSDREVVKAAFRHPPSP